MGLYFKNDLQDVLAELKKDKEYHEAAAKAWAAVEIVKTKTGAEYANIVRAIKNASAPSANEATPNMTVYFRTNLGGYQSDSLHMFGYRNTLPEDDPRRSSKYGYTYWLTPDEMRERIADHIKWNNAKAEAAAVELTKAEKAYNDFHAAIQAAQDALYKECAPLQEGAGSTLYYAIMER